LQAARYALPKGDFSRMRIHEIFLLRPPDLPATPPSINGDPLQMPFLTRAAFAEHVGALAAQIAASDETFAPLEGDAAAVAAGLSGLPIPTETDGIAAVSDTVKRAVAHLILHNRIGLLQGASPERLAWAKNLALQARADLAALRTRQPARTDDTGTARTGTITDTPDW
jgi:hypothetical protein